MKILLSILLLADVPNPNRGVPEDFVNGAGGVAGDVYFGSGEMACFEGDGTQSSIAYMGDEWCLDANSFAGSTLIAAETPTPYGIYGQSASPLTATAGGDLLLHGGLGQRTIAMTAANATGDTVILAITTTAAAAANCTCTELDGTTDATRFDCTGETDAVCATNLATCLNANTACVGIDACAGTACTAAAGFTGTAGTVYVYRDPSEPAARSVVLDTATATCDNAAASCVLTSGTDGITVIGPSLTQVMAMAFGCNTSACPGFQRNGTQIRAYVADGSALTILSGGSLFAAVSSGIVDIEVANGSFVQWDGAAYKSFWLNTSGELATGTGSGQATPWGTIAEKCWTSGVIDLNSVAKQTIMTVPTGRVFYPRSVTVRDPSAGIATAVGTFDCNTTADTDDTGFGTATLVLTASTGNHVYHRTVVGLECAAGATFGYDGSVAEVAADTVIMDVCGLLK